MTKAANRLYLFFIFTVAAMLQCAPSYAKVSGLEHQKVARLDIIIAAPSGSMPQTIAGTIKSRLKTREGDLFSQTAFDADLKLLAQDYDHIEPEVELLDGKLHITLKIWPNPTIRTIHWNGNERVKSSRLQSELGIRSGATFVRENFNKAFHSLKTYYVKQGFFEAELRYDVEYVEETNEVEISICIEEGRAGKIKKISFCNFSKKEEEDLACLMVTKEHNFFLSWLTGEGTYNEDMIQHDKLVIVNYLQNMGYADAQVDIQVVETKQHNRINICITADKGERYRFGTVVVNGNTIYSDEELSDCLLVKEGCPFSPELLHETMTRITNRYGKCGYIETAVNYEANLRENEFAYDIEIDIEEGEQFFIGMIKVFGNCRTQTKVILHECLLVPGEVFNLGKLKVTEARLCNIGYFKNVNVYAVRTEGESLLPGNYRDVHIEVEEANTGHMGAFFGFSTSENVFGGFNIAERNFNICGLRRLWSDGLCALRGAGEYANFTVQLGAKSSSYAISWTKPHYLDTPWSVGFDIDRSYNDYYSDNYDIRSYGLTLHATYDYNAFVRTGVHYRIRYTDVHRTKDDGCGCYGDKDDHDGNDNQDKLYYKYNDHQKKSGLISALGMSVIYDSTDSPFKPTCGLKSRIECEIAGLGGDAAFFSTSYLNCYYYNLWGKGVLKLRGDLRFIEPLGSTHYHDIPLDERIFLGGDDTVRGYRSYRLGPKFVKVDKHGNTCKRDDEDPSGGISMQLYSVEYSKCLFSRMDAFLFFDAGCLEKKSWNFGRYYLSAGYGCRFQVFEYGPPLTVGMGYPINPRDSSDVKKFFITVGGKF